MSILYIFAGCSYATTRVKEGEEITESQRINGHGNQDSKLLARQAGRDVAWHWHGQCGFRDVMKDVTTRLVRVISGEKMTLSTHQGGEGSQGGEGGGLGWNGAVSTLARARGP